QLISVVGTRLSTFALGIWALETTGSTTRYAVIFICMAVPALLLSPVAGALVDRWDRRRVMIVSDAVAASTVLVLALLHMTGRLHLHHVYIAAAVQAVVSAF